MKKFGVDEDLPIKTAQADGQTKPLKCPRCSSEKIEEHGNIMLCENCGSEPFETHIVSP